MKENRQKSRYPSDGGPLFEILKYNARRGFENRRVDKLRCRVCGKIVYGRWIDYKNSRFCNHFNTYTGVISDPIDRSIRGIYNGILRRCYDEKCRGYKDYGGRGIRMCDEWRNDVKAFEKWMKKNGWAQKSKLSIDRIDNDGHYSPSNCRIVSISENTRWNRNTHGLTIDGETLTGPQWGKRIGVGESRVRFWVKQYGEEYAIKKVKAYMRLYGGKQMSETERAEANRKIIMEMHERGCDIAEIADCICHSESLVSRVIMKETRPEYSPRYKTDIAIPIRYIVHMLDKDTGKVIRSFGSFLEANLFLGKSRTSPDISNVCKGKGQTAYGYRWSKTDL